MDTKDTLSSPDESARPALPEDVEQPEQHAEAVPEPKKSPTPMQESLRRFRRDTRSMICLAIMILFLLIPLIGPPIYRNIGPVMTTSTGTQIHPQEYRDPYHQELDNQDQGPSAYYWLGTDSIGRDLLARLMQGLLISFAVAIVVEIVTDVLGLIVGTLAGYFGGWMDQILARFTDIMFAFPGLLFAILLTGIFGSSADTFFDKVPLVGGNGYARLILVSCALSLVSWPLVARLVRGQTLQIKEQPFIEAARASGASSSKTIIHHIIPNLFSLILVQISLSIGGTIIGEAGLSFLGLGVQPPGSSIGLMINDAANLVDTYPWEVLFPSIVLTIIVLCLSFIGDGMRDAFDPRSKD
ncbi:peptide/nickel transport system permease protein [Thermosporothrix hazakensis]|jgi:peptide/nickel transport system permease protein|uniref:Peptide/nickel transport system permease protein n=1 Tax=Thermosporothrix hazakensis TaxID=644383 RepID=A0A326UA66_THEHA|nr:ABC transporter permease [Thermosporothrix hazakensis]PZW32103.1 peptide/nickel transport system permease protein [Thermosporothrix hazakensis]GCE49569.1 peptide ABC transporter permease [Thermosporothrix hazakensis]